MGTRGCVAYKVGRGWRGINNANSSFPTYLGMELWKVIQRFLADREDKRDGLEAFIQYYIKERHEFTTNLLDRDTDDPDITSDDPDPLFNQYVYILNPANMTMTVLDSDSMAIDSVYVDPLEFNRKIPEGWAYTGNPNSTWFHIQVAKVDLLGPEPDWQEIEEAKHEGKGKRVDGYPYGVHPQIP